MLPRCDLLLEGRFRSEHFASWIMRIGPRLLALIATHPARGLLGET